MGTWRITIEGTGAHHNGGKPFDADQIAVGAVAKIMNGGHTIHKAEFTMISPPPSPENLMSRATDVRYNPEHRDPVREVSDG